MANDLPPPPYYVAAPDQPSQPPPPQDTVIIDGVPYTPTGVPGVYVSPWGQYGYVSQEAAGTSYIDPVTGKLTTSGGGQKFTALPDRYFEAGGGGARGMTPQELELAWAKLNQDDRQFAEQLAYQY